MKTNPIQASYFRPMLLILGMLIMMSGKMMAQEKNDHEKSGKQKVSIHITKEVDGVKTVVDTSFTVEEDFDVHQWMDENDMENDAKAHSRKFEKEISISIPDMAHNFNGSMPDTIIVNGDTIFLGMKGEELKIMLDELPELAEMNIEKFIDGDFKEPFHFEFHDMPGNCPHFRFEGHPGFPPMHQFMIPGLEGLMDIGNLENVVIKKKRHGKKIIINFNDEKAPKCPHHTYSYHEGCQPESNPGRTQKKVVIRHHNDKEVDENASVQRIQDGDKEVIIIRKNGKQK